MGDGCGTKHHERDWKGNEFCESGEKGVWDGLFLASPAPGTSQKDRPTDPDPSPSRESYDVDRSNVLIFV